MNTSTIELSTADGPMSVYEATPDGDSARRGDRDPRGVRRERPHRGRRPPLRRRGLPRGCAGPLPSRRRRCRALRRLEQGDAAVRRRGRRGHPRRRRRDARPPASAGFADDEIGIVGFCLGGRVTFLVSARRALGAGVSFYGGGHHRRQPGHGRAAPRGGGLARDAVAGSVRRPRRHDPDRGRRTPHGRGGAQRRCRPRSCGTRTRGTASTATPATASTPTPPPMVGGARSTGSRATWADTRVG